MKVAGQAPVTVNPGRSRASKAGKDPLAVATRGRTGIQALNQSPKTPTFLNGERKGESVHAEDQDAHKKAFRFAKLLVVSVLLHAPLTPWAALVGLLSLWSPPAEDVAAPPITGIPIDLIEDPVPPVSAPQEPAAAPATAGPDEPVLVTKPKKKP